MISVPDSPTVLDSRSVGSVAERRPVLDGTNESDPLR